MFLEVETISSTTDSDDDETYWSVRNYLVKQGAQTLHIRKGKHGVAMPLKAWNSDPSVHVGTPAKWPRWLDRKHKRRYRGRLEHYQISHACLHAGGRYFVTGGRVASVTDAAAVPELEVTAPLLEVEEPILWLAEAPQAIVWRGTEQQRVSNLTHRRDTMRSHHRVGLAGVVGCAVLLIGFVFFTLRD